jgi:hypothetical protein
MLHSIEHKDGRVNDNLENMWKEVVMAYITRIDIQIRIRSGNSIQWTAKFDHNNIYKNTCNINLHKAQFIPWRLPTNWLSRLA